MILFDYKRNKAYGTINDQGDVPVDERFETCDRANYVKNIYNGKYYLNNKVK